MVIMMMFMMMIVKIMMCFTLIMIVDNTVSTDCNVNSNMICM
jgi:hypothetical protein